MATATATPSAASTAMPKYVCEKCSKPFKTKNSLNSHLARKKPCETPSNIIVMTKESLDTLVEKKVKEIMGQAHPRPKQGHQYARHALSLFSGAGGDTWGLEAAGWRVTHFSEFNDPAIKTHKEASKTSQLLTTKEGATDIKKIPDSMFGELRDSIHLIFAGFPCQGFSHAGKKRQDDPRSELVHEFARATRLIQPEWIIGENVFGLLSRKGVFPKGTTPRPVIEIIKDIFAEIGYKLSYRVFNAIEVGVPQLRRRLIIVGHRGEKYPHIPWDTISMPTAPPTIRHILTDTLNGAVELPMEPYAPQTKSPHFWIHTEHKEPTGSPHPNMVRLVKGIRNLSSKERRELKETGQILTADDLLITEPDGLISFGVRKGSYHGQILDPDTPSKTIICAYNQCPRLFVGLYNPTINKYWIRTLTPSECGQIQGFPSDYPWQGTTKDKITQIGNAVPPPLATTVAQLLERATFSDIPQYISSIQSNVQGDSDTEMDE